MHHAYPDYLRALEDSHIKLEYCQGEIYAMAGGTPFHGELAAALIRLLGNALLGRCRVFTSDVKVRVEATDLTTFPDVSVVCGERRTSALDPHALVNPTLLIEVTSRSTEDYDRGEKLRHYQQLPSLRAVIFVSHTRPRLTAVTRTPLGWAEQEIGPGARLSLADPALELAVDEVYAGIALDPV